MLFSKQFTKFALVGLGSNVTLYLAYLLLTNTGVGHKLAMSLLYPIGILLTFILNKKWSFQNVGTNPGTFMRYFASYVLIYCLNFIGLVWLVDWAGFPHQIIQGCMIPLCAVISFVLQRTWVFQNQQGDLSLRAWDVLIQRKP